MNTIAILVVLLVLLSILPVLVSRVVATAARGRPLRRSAACRRDAGLQMGKGVHRPAALGCLVYASFITEHRKTQITGDTR